MIQKPTNIIEQLIRDEGCILHPYTDSKGIWTCGVGRNLEATGLSPEEQLLCPAIKKPYDRSQLITREAALTLLNNDVAMHSAHLSQMLTWTDSLDVIRRNCLINMCFNMGEGVPHGIHGLLSFTTTLDLIQQAKYDEAADHMEHSKWRNDVGDRAVRLAQQMRTGEWQ